MASIIVMVTLLAGGLLFPWRRAQVRAAAVIAWWAGRRAGPAGRPIEVIAEHARRLGREFRCQPRGQSFVRYEGHRRAYDAALAEGCVALGIEHLLEVLAPGPELDAERSRVEGRLELAGLDLQLPLV